MISLSRIYSGLCHAVATLQRSEGGKGGIRTLGTIARTLAFQASTFNHSATFPIIFERKQQLAVNKKLKRKSRIIGPFFALYFLLTEI